MATRSRQREIIILALVLGLLGCSSGLNQEIEAALNIEEEFRQACRIMQFEGDNSNYAIENRDLYVLQSVKGKVEAKSGYRWGKGEVTFKVRPLRGTKTYSAGNKKDGSFSVSNLPDGLYCYIAAAVGWQTEEGRILIHQGASSSASMEISLLID